MRAWKDSVSLKSSGHAVKNTTVPILNSHWSINAYRSTVFLNWYKVLFVYLSLPDDR